MGMVPEEWFNRLMILCIVLAFDSIPWVSYPRPSNSITIYTVPAWWWWVIYAVRDIFKLLNSANKRFAEVLNELKTIKKEYPKKKKR